MAKEATQNSSADRPWSIRSAAGAARRHMVLVLEDNADTRSALRDTLQHEGYDVFATADGREALDRLRADPQPSVVLLDLNMTPMSGVEFHRLQQDDALTASVPVVLVTAAPPDQRRELAALPVIRKPINLDELRFVIRRATATLSAPDYVPPSGV